MKRDEIRRHAKIIRTVFNVFQYHISIYTKPHSFLPIPSYSLFQILNSNPPNPESYIPKSYTTVRVIHATLASTAWLILFPLGSIIPRLRRDLVFPLHAGIQMFAYAVFAAAAGMGIWMAKKLTAGTLTPLLSTLRKKETNTR